MAITITLAVILSIYHFISVSSFFNEKLRVLVTPKRKMEIGGSLNTPISSLKKHSLASSEALI